MATRLRIRELLHKQGLTGYQLWLLSDKKISLSTAGRLARGEERALRTDMVDALCDVLKCEPGDLYHRTKK